MNTKAASTGFSKAVLVLICLLVALTPLMRGSVHLWAKTLIQLVTLAGVIVLLAEGIFTRSGGLRRSVFTGPMAAIAGLCLLTAVFAGQQGLAAEGLIMFFAYLGIYHLTIAGIRTPREQRLLIYTVIATAVFLAVFGLFKRFGMNPFDFWAYTPWFPGTALNSTFRNHNHLAGFLEMALPLLPALIFLRPQNWPRIVLLIYLGLLMLAAHLFSLSRGGWISLIIAMAFLVIVLNRQRQRRFRAGWLNLTIICLLAAMVLTIFAATPVFERAATLSLNETVFSIESRIKIWQGTIDMIVDHPLAGTGPGTYAYHFPAYQPPGFMVQFRMAHNDYLHFVAETGLLMAPLLLWLLIGFFRQGFSLMDGRDQQAACLSLGIMTAVVAMMVHSLWDFNLHIPANAVLFTVLSANIEIEFPADRKTRG